MRTLVLLAAVASSTLALAQAPLKTFRDARTGVSFQYPAAWKGNGPADFMPPAIVNGVGRPAKPTVTVGVAGVPGTTLTGIAFTFAWTPAAEVNACVALTSSRGFSGVLDDKPQWVKIGDNTLWRAHGSDAREGHSADQVVYAAFLPPTPGTNEQGRCLLFEEDIDLVAASIGDKPLAPVPRVALHGYVHALQAIVGTLKLPVAR